MYMLYNLYQLCALTVQQLHKNNFSCLLLIITVVLLHTLIRHIIYIHSDTYNTNSSMYRARRRRKFQKLNGKPIGEIGCCESRMAERIH